MGVGPNYVLDKGLVSTGAVAYALGELVVPSGDGTKSARATSAGALVVFVNMENCDAWRVQTGKAVLGTRILGIARVLAGAAVAVGAAPPAAPTRGEGPSRARGLREPEFRGRLRASAGRRRGAPPPTGRCPGPSRSTSPDRRPN